MGFSSGSLEGKKIFVVLPVCYAAKNIDRSVSTSGQVFFPLLVSSLLVLDIDGYTPS